MNIGLEAWILENFGGRGRALRLETDAPLEGEPWMSMDEAKELTRQAVALFAVTPEVGGERDAAIEECAKLIESGAGMADLIDQEELDQQAKYIRALAAQPASPLRGPAVELNNGAPQPRGEALTLEQIEDILCKAFCDLDEDQKVHNGYVMTGAYAIFTALRAQPASPAVGGLAGCLHPGNEPNSCQYEGKCLSMACDHNGKTWLRPRMTLEAQDPNILYPKVET